MRRSGMRRMAAMGFVAAWLLVASAVSAQTPPDVIELRNGGTVRGTLVENLPGDHVTIQLTTGEVRTFAASEVLRVGTGEAAAPSPYAQPIVMAPVEPTIELEVRSEEEGVSLHRLTGTASVAVWTGRGVGSAAIDQFQLICTAPCRERVRPGSYTFGVSQGNGMARRAGHSMFQLQGDATLELEYESREGIRIGGWVLFGVASAGYALGATLPLLGGGTDNVLEILLIATGAYLAVCIPVIVMVALNDHADVRQIADAMRDGIRF